MENMDDEDEEDYRKGFTGVNAVKGKRKTFDERGLDELLWDRKEEIDFKVKVKDKKKEKKKKDKVMVAKVKTIERVEKEVKEEGDDKDEEIPLLSLFDAALATQRKGNELIF